MNVSSQKNPVKTLIDSSLERAVGVSRHTGLPSSQHPATRELVKAGGEASGGYDWLGGQGVAERDLRRSYGLEEPARARRASGPSRGPQGDSREVHGPAYEMVVSDQTQRDDPQRHPHGVPPDLGPPVVAIMAGAPEEFSVSQAVYYAPRRQRVDAFVDAVLGAQYVNDNLADNYLMHTFSDRRGEDRPGRAGG